jgi:hypothetical protein
MYAFGEHVVGDSTLVLSRLDQRFFTERDGSAIRRLRAAPVLHGDGSRVYLDRFELYLEPGLNPVTSPTGDPQVSLAVSYDGGKTWGNERFVGAGRLGDYKRRLIWTRCGSGTSVQTRIVCSDPVPWNVIDCYIDGSGFQTAPRRGGEAAA